MRLGLVALHLRSQVSSCNSDWESLQFFFWGCRQANLKLPTPSGSVPNSEIPNQVDGMVAWALCENSWNSGVCSVRHDDLFKCHLLYLHRTKHPTQVVFPAVCFSLDHHRLPDMRNAHIIWFDKLVICSHMSFFGKDRAPMSQQIPFHIGLEEGFN